MYVKLFNSILDASIAENPKLRHFFTDLLLCADMDGNVLATNEAIANKIRATREDVEWGLKELQKPDKLSWNQEHGGRRIVPIGGRGYGWHIVSFCYYRDMKNSAQRRSETAARVRKFREKKKALKKLGLPLPGEQLYEAAESVGCSPIQKNSIAAESLPDSATSTADFYDPEPRCPICKVNTRYRCLCEDIPKLSNPIKPHLSGGGHHAGTCDPIPYEEPAQLCPDCGMWPNRCVCPMN